MKQELLDKLLTDLLSIVEKGTTLVAEQLPLIAQELLQYRLCIAIVGVGIGLLFFILAALVFSKTKNVRCTDTKVGITIGAIILAVVGASIVLANGTTAIKIKIAPRLYVIDYLRHIR